MAFEEEDALASTPESRRAPVARAIVGRAEKRRRQRRDAVRAECKTLRREAPGLLVQLCRSAARFHRLNGPRWCGYSSLRDYCAERLGISTSQFYRWVREHHLLEDAPAVAALHTRGILGESALAEIAHALTPPQAEAALPDLLDLNIRELRGRLAEIRAAAAALEKTTLETGGSETAASRTATAATTATTTAAALETPTAATAATTTAAALETPTAATAAPSPSTSASSSTSPSCEPRDQIVRIRVPSAFAPYIENTLRLGEALIGSESDDEMRLGAVLAEASSEIEFTISAADALRRLMPTARRASSAGVQRPPAVPLGRSSSSAVQKDASSLTPASKSANGDLRTSQHSSPREQAHSLDLQLRRLLARRRRLAIRHEDRLLHFHREGIHALFFYPRFEFFARAELGLAPSTVYEMLDRARRRRHEDPIALAHARGTITALQSTLLRQLHRLGIPRSDLQRWIDTAAHLSVRGLRDRIAWARRQVHRDYRAWSLAGCPPPTEVDLRTSQQSLRDLAAHPTPPSILDASPHGYHRFTTFEWILTEDTTAFLAQEIASIQDRATHEGHPRCPTWAALVILCHHARRAWSQMEKPRSKKAEAVLDRDDWRCAVPGCSSRRSLQRHHIVFASRGGGDEAENLVSLCAFHHLIGVHQGLIRVRGKAHPGAENLLFELGLRPHGHPLAVYRGDHRCSQRRTS